MVSEIREEEISLCVQRAHAFECVQRLEAHLVEEIAREDSCDMAGVGARAEGTVLGLVCCELSAEPSKCREGVDLGRHDAEGETGSRRA